MNLSDYLTEELTLVGMEATDKREVCEKMVAHLVEKSALAPERQEALVQKLMEREALSSTGVGGSVGIPHASGEDIDTMLVVMGQFPAGVEFDALDDEPVQLVFMIIGSERSPRSHLQLLAMIVRICKNRELVEKLIAASDSATAYHLATHMDEA